MLFWISLAFSLIQQMLAIWPLVPLPFLNSACLNCRNSLSIWRLTSYQIYVLCFCSAMSLFVTPWTVTCKAPLSMGFSRQGYWSGLPCPLPGALPDPGIEPRSPALQADSLPSEPAETPYQIVWNIFSHIHFTLLSVSFVVQLFSLI